MVFKRNLVVVGYGANELVVFTELFWHRFSFNIQNIKDTICRVHADKYVSV